MLLNRSDVPPSWETLFEENKNIIEKILRITFARGRFFPDRANLFRAFFECRLEDVRVIITGQDPYKRSDQACGMSFSLPPGQKPSPSLVNIYKCIQKSYPSFVIPQHGDLRAWCKQGVLLLNMCLAYFPDNPMSTTEMKYCMPFVTKVIREVCSVNPSVVVVLWGKEAQTLLTISSLPGSVNILTGVHPSSMNGKRFIEEVNHFKEINDILDTPIDWSLK